MQVTSRWGVRDLKVEAGAFHPQDGWYLSVRAQCKGVHLWGGMPSSCHIVFPRVKCLRKSSGAGPLACAGRPRPAPSVDAGA